MTKPHAFDIIVNDNKQWYFALSFCALYKINSREEHKMEMVYGVKDRPKFGRLLLFSLQQLLAILAATIAVPMIIGNGMQPSAALFGAGIGTIVYLLLTKFRSPVFLGS